MAKPTVIAFVQRMETDEALQKRVDAIGSVEKGAALTAITKIAADAGFAFSPDELAIGLRELSSGELGDADLDAVSGGAGTSTPTLQPTSKPKPVTTLVKLVYPGGTGTVIPCFEPVLSAEDAADFHAFGFTVIRGCFGPEQMEALGAAFDRSMLDAPSYDAFGRNGSRVRSRAEDADPAFVPLIGGERLMAAIGALSPAGTIYLGSFLLDNRDDT